MLCRYCGEKLGMMQQWRYGDFCSKEHKQEFAAETQRALAERLKSSSRPSGTLGLADEVESAEEQVADVSKAADEPAPAEMDFLPQGDAAPIGPPQPVAAPEAAPRKESRPDWKYLAKVADLEAPPAALQVVPSKYFLEVDLEEAPPEDKSEFMHPARRSVFVPQLYEARKTSGLPAADLQPAESFAGQAWATLPEPMTVPRTTWIDDSGRRWIATAPVEAGLGAVPSMAGVLEQYPQPAPWRDWPIEEWLRAGREAAEKGTSRPAPAMATPQSGPMPPPPSGLVADGQEKQKAGSLAPVAPLPTNPVRASAAAPGAPGREGAAPTPMLPRAASPAGTGATPAAGRTAGPSARPEGPAPAAKSGNEQGTPVRQAKSSGPAWTPIVPPIFHALVDIAHDMQPIAMKPSLLQPSVTAELPDGQVPPTAPEQAEQPWLRAAPGESGLTHLPMLSEAQRLHLGFRSGDSRPTDLRPAHCLPRLSLKNEKPGMPLVPRNLRLEIPMFDQWTPPQAEPVIYLGDSGRY